MSSSSTSKSATLFGPIKSHSSSSFALGSTLLAIALWGVYAYYVQVTTGLGVTGMRSVVSWAFYIINFVFFIGISHVGALMSAILRLTNADWRKPITRIAEVVTFFLEIFIGEKMQQTATKRLTLSHDELLR